MGNTVSTWFGGLFQKKKASIVMIGLDAAGKTTILDKLKLGASRETVPTIGFHVETVDYHNVTFHLWDVGGQKRLRALWKMYYDGANAVIFVVDSNDRARVAEVREELRMLLTDALLAGAALLVLCNKQDLPQRMTPAELVDGLGFRDVSETGLGRCLVGRKWFVQGCCAHTGEGLYEGLDWMCAHLPDDI
ncbi:ADP-ribosylation factor [Novymonas esmeraldas]|uniref:ADP-ribosylation factor-like protein 11 n=1 Tax=Novymonas esmeraldas TaxID=1808958 RepID=A0AAW0F7D3_9TRYP